MKKLSFLSTKTGRVLLLSCFSLVLLLSSCLKSKDNEPLPVGDAKIQYVNAVQGSDTQDFYVTNTKLGTPVAYGESSDYFTVTNDNTLFSFKKTGSSDVSATIQGRLEIGGNYTFYYYKDNTGAPAAIFPISNEQAVPPAGKARVRFIHLNRFIADASPLVVKIKDGDNLVTNLKFGYTNYYTVDPGTKLDIIAAGATLSAFDANIEAGKTYTIWIGGSSSILLDAHVVRN